jgi:hypothetical protein
MFCSIAFHVVTLDIMVKWGIASKVAVPPVDTIMNNSFCFQLVTEMYRSKQNGYYLFTMVEPLLSLPVSKSSHDM